MRMTKIRIRHFRSIADLPIPLDPFTIFCGPNSCGKSNIFRAILLAFKSSISPDDALKNLPTSMLNSQGAPKMSIWIDCDFTEVPPTIQKLAKVSSAEVRYAFRLSRTGTVTRKLGNETLGPSEFSSLLDLFSPIYVPPIRDLNADGLLPFRQLMKSTLQKAKGPDSLRGLKESAQELLEKKGQTLLTKQGGLTQNILQVNKLSLDMSDLDIESIYENVGLRVSDGAYEQPLSSLGTGHQSAVIMSLYRQLGEDLPGKRLYLFEEPDNHLHPTTVRAICNELRSIAESSQVLVSTHSPTFLTHVEFNGIRPLIQKKDISRNSNVTQLRDISILKNFNERQVRIYLNSLGIKIIEPLLCQKVIVVEGLTDKIVLSTLFEKRRGRTVDQSDIMLVAAGGKEKLILLAHILSCLDLDWHCVLDRDAAYSADLPILKRGLHLSESSKGLNAIQGLTDLIDTSTKRGRNTIKQLEEIHEQLTSGPPIPTPYEGSVLQRLLTKIRLLDPTEQRELKNCLIKQSAKKRERDLLKKARVTLWSSTIEEVLLKNSNAEDCAEATLIKSGILTGALPKNDRRHATLRNRLHELANEPEKLADVVLALEEQNYFARTELNANFDSIFSI